MRVFARTKRLESISAPHIGCRYSAGDAILRIDTWKLGSGGIRRVCYEKCAHSRIRRAHLSEQGLPIDLSRSRIDNDRDLAFGAASPTDER